MKGNFLVQLYQTPTIYEPGCLQGFHAKCWQAAAMDQSQAASAAIMKVGNGPNKHLAGWEVTAFPSAWNTYLILLKCTCVEAQVQTHVFFLLEVVTTPDPTSLEWLYLSKTFLQTKKMSVEFLGSDFFKHHRVNNENNKSEHSDVDRLLPGRNLSVREASLALWEPPWALFASGL